VFEPNNQGLWAKLSRSITDFLTRAWRDGALYGATAKEAFYVRIDETLNPDSERALGRLTIEIGVRPSYPAEFIIVRIGIWQGGSTVSES
jgi:phage tail sheath protein FI